MASEQRLISHVSFGAGQPRLGNCVQRIPVPMSSKPFTNDQPIDGERILQCLHIVMGVATEPWDWFRIKGGVKFRRPDGTKAKATWLVVCHDCFLAYKDDIQQAPMAGDAVWQGNAPAIREASDDEIERHPPDPEPDPPGRGAER